ncbi:hypothetical protein POVWA1_082080 [Plasmodium ovale wallikeri]|uniref:Uncharacterized protein n=1 Tax=Plasmodium ovale wallikeri TaxID=864142 RepID=A0A1A9AMU7_PLAOA|nr:hypothetical protein POVWA1_082080 [Plasmodium ovale wallikeri]
MNNRIHITLLSYKKLKDQVDAGKPAEVTDAKAPSIQQLPEPPSSISLKDSLAAKVLDPRPPVIKDQGAVSDATPSTTSATSDTTHSIQNILAPPAPDFSLAQPQSPTVDKVTAQYSKETAPPDPVGKSPNQDALVTPALGPGLAPPQAAASNSSASETSSTTTISTIGSSLDKDPHFPTLSTQPIVTTSVDTTVTQTVASVSNLKLYQIPKMKTLHTLKVKTMHCHLKQDRLLYLLLHML